MSWFGLKHSFASVRALMLSHPPNFDTLFAETSLAAGLKKLKKVGKYALNGVFKHHEANSAEQMLVHLFSLL